MCNAWCVSDRVWCVSFFIFLMCLSVKWKLKRIFGVPNIKMYIEREKYKLKRMLKTKNEPNSLKKTNLILHLGETRDNGYGWIT